MTQHQWVGPLAAVCVGCVSMIIFRFVRRVILDGVDTKFLCFAIDQHYVVDGANRDGGRAGSADPVVSVEIFLDPEAPIVPGVILRELPPEAKIAIDENEGGSGGDIDLEDGIGMDDDRFYDVVLDPESDTEVRVAETSDEDAQGRPQKRRRFRFW